MANGLLLGNPVQSFNDGYDRGQQKKFNALAGQAIADPSNTNTIGAAASIDPGRAVALQQNLQATQDAKLKKIAGAANYVLTAYKSGNPAQVQGAYQAVKPFLAQLGQEHGMVPPDQFSDDMLPQLYQLVGEGGGGPAAAQTEGVVVAPGGALVDKSTGKTLYSAPDKPPAAIQSMQYLQQHPDLAQFQVDQRNAMRPQKPATSGNGPGLNAKGWVLGYDEDGNGVRINKETGDIVPLSLNGKPIRKPTAAPKPSAGGSTRPPNNEQANAAGFASRMLAASAEMDQLTGGGYDPTNVRDRASAGVGGIIGNVAMSDQGQRFQQAAQNWVRANLRKESGAAIGKDEMQREIENYFPMAGDSPGVVQQKANNRHIVEQAMIRTAGPAWNGGGAAASPSPASNTSRGGAGGGQHQVGDVINVGGKQYRVVGGDPNDPDVEPL